jgi:hypothetical protein
MWIIPKIIFAGARTRGSEEMGCTPAKDFDEAWKLAENGLAHPRTLYFQTWSKMRLLESKPLMLRGKRWSYELKGPVGSIENGQVIHSTLRGG